MRELQEWMYTHITAPLPPPDAEVATRILPSRTLQPSERLALYRDMYTVRMTEALETDYPAFAALFGHHAFEHLVEAYCARYPSSSYTLNRFGDHFPQFVAETMPRRRALHDLARFELAMTEVFDEAESPVLDANAIANVPPEAVESLRIVPIRALRLLALDYPVNDLFRRFRDDEPLRVPRPKKTWLAIYRREFAVLRMPLTEGAFALLSMLCDGAPLGEVVMRFPDQQELFTSFRDWTASGLFSAVTTEG